MSGGARRRKNPDAGSDGRCTPWWFAIAIGRFGTDPCSNPRSHVDADVKYSLETRTDGLLDPWLGSVFANFPFSKPLPWCVRLAQHEDTWVALHKLDPTTTWWRTLMSACDDWAPFRWRFKFERNDRTTITPNFTCALTWRRWDVPVDVAPHLWIRRRSVVVSSTDIVIGNR